MPCLRAPRTLFLSSLKTYRVVEPTINSTHIRFRTLKPLNINKMESLQNTGLDTKEWEKDKSDATTSETNAHVCRKRRQLIANRTATMDRHSEKCLLPGSSRSEKLRSLAPGLTRVPPAHFGGRKPARRGCSTRGLLQREISTGAQQLDRRHCFAEFGKHGGHFLPRCHRALQGWKRRTPPRSRDPHVHTIWTVLILEFLRQGHWSMGIYLLWMVTCYFRPGAPQSMCESLPLTATALSHGNTTERIFNFSDHDFLVVWSKVIEATRLGDFIQLLVP